MLTWRTVLLASAACLAVNLKQANAQAVSACYADSKFQGPLQPVANEAECRKQCATSTFAAIQVRLVGSDVNGLCRCGNLPPAGPQSGLCSTPCTDGGNCGGTDVEAVLDIAAAGAAPPLPPAPPARNNGTVPALVGGPAATPLTTPATPVTSGRPARRPVVPTTATVAPGTVTKQVRQGPADTSGGLPSSLLITGATILGGIILVPFVVVSCLRYQRRRVAAAKPREAPYNSTAKRLRPVSSTMFLDDPAPFPEMRGSAVTSPGSALYRARPNFVQPPTPTLSVAPGGMGYFVPAGTTTRSVYSRPESDASSSYSSQGSSHRLPDGYAAYNYSGAPQAAVLGSNYGVYDEAPNGGQVYVGAGNSLSVVPHLAFDVDYGNFDGVIPPADRASSSYIAQDETDR